MFVFRFLLKMCVYFHHALLFTWQSSSLPTFWGRPFPSFLFPIKVLLYDFHSSALKINIRLFCQTRFQGKKWTFKVNISSSHLYKHVHTNADTCRFCFVWLNKHQRIQIDISFISKCPTQTQIQAETCTDLISCTLMNIYGGNAFIYVKENTKIKPFFPSEEKLRTS